MTHKPPRLATATQSSLPRSSAAQPFHQPIHPIHATTTTTMSSLLQSVLSAKLAGTSLDEEGRANANANANNEDWEEVNTSDEELVGESAPLSLTHRDLIRLHTARPPVAIATAPGTGTATPLNISRPTSPGTGTSSGSGSGTKLKSSPLLGNERPVKVKAPKSKTDPLRSLPKEVSLPRLCRVVALCSHYYYCSIMARAGIPTHLPLPLNLRAPLPLPRMQAIPQVCDTQLLLV